MNNLSARVALTAAALALPFLPAQASAQADLNDLEMAHVAVTASNIDIAYAHLALALSENPDVRGFAQRMIADHTAVNGQVADLARKLNVTAQDNPLSQQLLADAKRIKQEMAGLQGAAFDRYYARNELGYHQTVNGVVEDMFIPNIENREVKEAFSGALQIFRGHEAHAAQLAAKLGVGQ